jgi:hypothetical protein
MPATLVKQNEERAVQMRLRRRTVVASLSAVPHE